MAQLDGVEGSESREEKSDRDSKPACPETNPGPGPQGMTASPGQAGPGSRSVETAGTDWSGTSPDLAATVPTGDRAKAAALAPEGWKAESLVGTVLADKYEILAVLGRGGMSVVYKARHLLMKKAVAIKVLLPQLVLNPQSLKRFQQEAEAASCLSHPNVITVYDFGVSEHGLPYLVMDLLHGQSLAEALREKGALDVQRALDIFVPACSALGEAHRKGVIHRDLKPSNIMLVSTDSGTESVKIVDFGIAKVLPQEGEEFQKLTQTGEIFGSPFYMSPEQCMGLKLDARSDIYSFGCLMYETLTGKPPLVGAHTLDTMFKHMNETPQGLAGLKCEARVRERLEMVIFKALAKTPEQRYQSMKELEDDLELLRSGRDTGWLGRAETILRGFQARRAARKPPRKAVVILVCLVVLFGLIASWAVAGAYRSLADSTGEGAWRKPVTEAPLDASEFKIKEMGLRFFLLLHQERAQDKPDVLASKWAKMGQFYKREQHYTDAIEAFKKSIAILAMHGGGESAPVAQLRLNLGDCYYLDGQYKQAQECYKSALAFLEKEFGQEYQDLAVPLSNLADIYAREGKLAEAEQAYEKSLSVFEAHYQGESLDFALAASRLGDLYRQQGRLSDAERVYSKALAQWENMQSAQPHNLALCHARLGTVLARLKNYREADEHYTAALNVLSRESLLHRRESIPILQGYSDML
ncbi:MAG TPA: serine/threonine-protein kinase, partial [Candidatus Obscuribacterales bacterium]